jgi:hypothetical protein
LLAEVERLHQELAIRESSEQEKVIDYLGKECVDWEDKYLALAGENAKLRELVRDMWREGAFEAGANYVTEAYGLEERTRELGIEVDG